MLEPLQQLGLGGDDASTAGMDSPASLALLTLLLVKDAAGLFPEPDQQQQQQQRQQWRLAQEALQELLVGAWTYVSTQVLGF